MSTRRPFNRRLRSGSMEICAGTADWSKVKKQTASTVFPRKCFDTAKFIRVTGPRVSNQTLNKARFNKWEQNILEARYLVVNRLASKCIQRPELSRIGRVNMLNA